MSCSDSLNVNWGGNPSLLEQQLPTQYGSPDSEDYSFNNSYNSDNSDCDSGYCADYFGTDRCLNSNCPSESDCLCPATGDITGGVYLLDSGATTTGGVWDICSLQTPGTASLFQPGLGSLVTVNPGGYSGLVQSGTFTPKVVPVFSVLL